MSTPSDRKYAKTHEWARDDGDGTVTVGITEHAQEALGDVVFVELPEVGQEVTAGAEFGVVESVKAASDLYSPVSGEVTEVNDRLESAPETINEDPFEAGWIMKVHVNDAGELDDLLDGSDYDKLAAAED